MAETGTEADLLGSAAAAIAADIQFAERVLHEAYTPMMNDMIYGEEAGAKAEIWETERALRYWVERIATRSALVMEWMGLIASRDAMLDEVREKLSATDNILGWWHSSEGEGPECLPLEAVTKHAIFLPAQQQEHASAERLAAAEATGKVAAQLEFIEHVMTALPGVITELGERPSCETDIQRHLRRHLKAAFPGFVPSPSIAKPIQGFKPDCGILELALAVEVKYVNSETEFKAAYRGITEDLSGYAGSRDWTRFYSYIYMTGAYGTQKQFERALGAHGTAGTWRSVVATGPGTR